MLLAIGLARRHWISWFMPDTRDSTTAGKTMKAENPSFAATWAIVGASGFCGAEIVRCCLADGLNIRRIVGPRLTAPPVRHLSQLLNMLADPAIDTHIRNLSDQLAGVDVVVNAAGIADSGASESSQLFGANTLLPLVIYKAALRAGVQRMIQVSSASVLGNVDLLTEDPAVHPFSPYSMSKANAELALSQLHGMSAGRCDLTMVRGTSVQGPDRSTTKRICRVASTRLASVAFPGTQPTPITSCRSLATLIVAIGLHADDTPQIVLQPWEGLSVSDVMSLAGGKPPVVLSQRFCRFVVRVGQLSTRFLPKRSRSIVRQVELMWFGQHQVHGWADRNGVNTTRNIKDVFELARQKSVNRQS